MPAGVQRTISKLGNTDTWVVAFIWTADVLGSVPVTAAQIGNELQGYFVTQVETNPGSPAPTSGYSVRIQNANGFDVLDGAAASLSNSTSESFPASGSAPPLQGTLTLVLTGNSVANANGAVYIYLIKPVGGLVFPVGLIASGANWLTLTNSPVADVRAFGAKCDGVTDDTAAVAAAMASLPDSSASTFYYCAGGGTVLFPPGLCKADVRIRSGILLKGMGPGAAIMATGANKTIVATIPGSFWIGIEDLDIQIDQKASVIGLAIISTQRGNIRNVNIGGGVGGMTTGVGLLMQGTAAGQTAFIHFHNFIIDIGPATGMAVDGYNTTMDPNDAKAITFCSWTNCRITNCDATKAVVDLRKWCDTNQLTNFSISSSAAVGMVVNSDTPGSQMDVDGWFCINLIIEGITTTGIQFAACQNWTIIGLSNLSAVTTYTKTALSLALRVLYDYQGPQFYDSTVPFQLGATDKPTALQIPPFTVTLANGVNSNIDATNKSNLKVIGPTGAFSITGFAGGVNGQKLAVTCAVAQACTITHNATSSAGNKISTLIGTDIVGGVHYSHFEFEYDGVDAIWLLTNYNA